MEQRTRTRRMAWMTWGATLAAALILAAGCGGGGGGGGSDSGGGGGGGAPAGMVDLGSGAPAAGVYLEVTGSRGLRYDPFSLRVGNKVQVGVYQYSSTGTRTALAGTNWSLAGATSSQATISSTGVLEAKAVTPRPFSVSARATVAGVSTVIVQDFQITNWNTVIAGNVRSETGSAGMRYIQVEAADSAGNVVAGAMTGDDGRFTMRVPTGTTRISVKKESIPSATHIRQIRFNNRDYSADVSGCSIRITAPTANAVTSLSAPILVLVKTTGPPPPPPNCFGS